MLLVALLVCFVLLLCLIFVSGYGLVFFSLLVCGVLVVVVLCGAFFVVIVSFVCFVSRCLFLLLVLFCCVWFGCFLVFNSVVLQ